MGSAGIGSTGHLAGELFKMMAGVNMIHVPYRGNAPALTDLIAGQIEVLFPSLGSSIEYVKTGKLRALAVPPRPHELWGEIAVHWGRARARPPKSERRGRWSEALARPMLKQVPPPRSRKLATAFDRYC